MLLCLVFMCMCSILLDCNAFTTPTSHACGRRSLPVAAKDSKDPEEAWDANVDYDKEWPDSASATPDPSTAWDALPEQPDLSAKKLGIDLNLDQLSQEEAKKLQDDAKEIINQQIDKGVQDIEKLRQKMTKELDQSRKIMQFASELQAKQKSEELMDKIDKLTGNFLDSTKSTREGTKLAARASKAMEGTNKGLEMGTWGTLGGRTVVAEEAVSLLGSVDNAKQKASGEKEDTTEQAEQAEQENRIVLLADTKQVCTGLGFLQILSVLT